MSDENLILYSGIIDAKILLNMAVDFCERVDDEIQLGYNLAEQQVGENDESRLNHMLNLLDICITYNGTAIEYFYRGMGRVRFSFHIPEEDRISVLENAISDLTHIIELENKGDNSFDTNHDFNRALLWRGVARVQFSYMLDPYDGDSFRNTLEYAVQDFEKSQLLEELPGTTYEIIQTRFGLSDWVPENEVGEVLAPVEPLIESLIGIDCEDEHLVVYAEMMNDLAERIPEALSRLKMKSLEIYELIQEPEEDVKECIQNLRSEINELYQ